MFIRMNLAAVQREGFFIVFLFDVLGDTSVNVKLCN
jgi:hypothetical protein